MQPAVLLLLSVGVALWLGATRPRLGVIIFVSLVGISSGLAWRLGLTNLAIPHAYLLGLLLGGLSYYLRSGNSDTPGAFDTHIYVELPCIVLFGVTALATVVAVVRAAGAGLSSWLADLLSSATTLLTYGPSGAVASVAFSAAVLSGPLAPILVTTMDVTALLKHTPGLAEHAHASVSLAPDSILLPPLNSRATEL